jgi:tetratricopeptide (TPR) repeat protein
VPVASLLISSLLGTLSAFPAASDVELLQQAEAAFGQGKGLRAEPDQARKHFRKAADLYEELRQRGVQNADLFRNQGNAYALANDLPRALLAYHRGLRLAPGDAGLHVGLTEARRQVAETVSASFGLPSVGGRPPWLPYLGPGLRLTLTLLLYGLACAALTRWWMTRQGSWLLSTVVVFTTSALLGFELAQDERQQVQEISEPLVVIATDGVLLHKGNGATYPCYDARTRKWLDPPFPQDVTPLVRGVEARRLFTRGAWLQIQLSSGEIGWVRREQVLVDE